ncbi:hypothetical protein QTP70_021367 [Hemibagrus guttatus]|uniref:Uncharacterized protein n=1 Tax=Hemibagrus guttatus TaxID=175788 RepID=A0AAE0UGQ5_9TELE|nr:hypothetical protein QTP70_021367 [Hemibagrus guttatus]
MVHQCPLCTGIRGNRIMKMMRTVLRFPGIQKRRAGMTVHALIKKYGSVRKVIFRN